MLGEHSQEVNMRITKGKVLAAVAVLVALALVASAGGDKDKIAKLKAELNLTDAQATQLKSEFEKLQPMYERVTALKKELKALESAANPDQQAISAKKSELQAAKKEVMAKYDAVYRSVLTSEQYVKLEALRAQEKKKEHTKKY